MTAPTLHPHHGAGDRRTGLHHVRTTAAASGFAGTIGGWHWKG
jgi:hypothetical protein